MARQVESVPPKKYLITSWSYFRMLLNSCHSTLFLIWNSSFYSPVFLTPTPKIGSPCKVLLYLLQTKLLLTNSIAVPSFLPFLCVREGWKEHVLSDFVLGCCWLAVEWALPYLPEEMQTICGQFKHGAKIIIYTHTCLLLSHQLQFHGVWFVFISILWSVICIKCSHIQ